MNGMRKLLAAVLTVVMTAGFLPADTLAARSAAESAPALREIGVRVGGDYVAAAPEEDSIMPFSLLPLTEKFFILDLTGYFPDELKAVKLQTVIDSLVPYDEGVTAETEASEYVVWGKRNYYDDDGNYVGDNGDFTVLRESDTLDLSNRYGDYQLELIVGTADQLNTDNTRYIVQVYTGQGLADMLDFGAMTAGGEPIQVYNHQNYYIEDQNGKSCYQITVDPENFPGGECGLTFGFSDKWRARDWSEVKVYQGCYKTEAELSADTARDITAQVWAAAGAAPAPAGFRADYCDARNMPEFTLVLKKEGTTRVVPFGVSMYAGKISVGVDGLYMKIDDESAEWFDPVYCSSDYEDDTEAGIQYQILHLPKGYELSETYCLRLYAFDPAEEAGDYSHAEKIKSAHAEHIESGVESGDIKEYLFFDETGYEEGWPDGYMDGGYEVTPDDCPGGLIFTVVDMNGEASKVGVRFEGPSDELPPAPAPLSEDTYFHMDGAAYGADHGGSEIFSYVMPFGGDSCYDDGYQTVFLLDRAYGEYSRGPVAEGKIVPCFTLGSGVNVTSNGTPYGPDDPGPAREQFSGESEVTFQSGVPILYSAEAEDGKALKNYVVTFLTQQESQTLFVNGTNYPAAYQDDPQNEGEKIPARTVRLTEEYDFRHDIFFANLSAGPLTGLYVTLTGPDGTGQAEGVVLDDYWTIGETRSLAGFTTTESRNSSGQDVYYGGLPNVGKICLRPKRDENGGIISGKVSGLLTIGAGTGESRQEVRILLSGIAGEGGTPGGSDSSGESGSSGGSSSSDGSDSSGGSGSSSWNSSSGGGNSSGESDFSDWSSSSSEDSGYAVSTPSGTQNGAVSVSPGGAKAGSAVTVTITPDDGYKLDKLIVTDAEGNVIEVTKQSDGTFSFLMPSSKVDIEAVFVKNTDGPVAGFKDVSPGVYYADAVTWAAEKGIAAGTGADTFSPNSPCTRAQIVTFLWRAAGSPVIEGEAAFDDVAPDSYYYDAVKWAAVQGITAGTGKNIFSPNAACTRAQAVTFLYSYEQSPAVSGGNEFTDVAGSAYYTDAVQWAVDRGVTVGTGATTFGPNAVCTRGQIVTFLYRDMA